MEGSFSVSTNNRFAFFMNEDDDPGDVVLDSSKPVAAAVPKPKESPAQQSSGKDEKSPQVKKKEGSKDKGQAQTGKKPEGNGKKKEPSED